MPYSITQKQVHSLARKTSEFLLVPAFFFLPIQAAPVNSLLVLAIIAWLFTGNLKHQLYTAWQHPLTKAFLFFVFTAWLSLLWTENIEQGLWFAKKYITYLVFPIILLIVNPNHFKLYLGAFFSGIAISELLSYGLWLDIIQLDRANPDNTAFIGHILYSPIVAFAAYIMLSRLFIFWEKTSKFQKIASIFFSTTIIVNLFFTHGRTGMVALLALIVVLFLLKFKNHRIKALFAASVISIMIIFTAYKTLDDFKIRIDSIQQDLEQLLYEQSAKSSVGNRLINWVYSVEMIKQNPLLGVGLGDYGDEFNKIAATKSYTTVTDSINPHNQYFFTWTTSGIIGLISLAILFGVMLQATLKTHKKNKELRAMQWGLITLFVIICLAESYLWRSNTGLLLMMFSALLFHPKITKKDPVPTSDI